MTPCERSIFTALRASATKSPALASRSIVSRPTSLQARYSYRPRQEAFWSKKTTRFSHRCTLTSQSARPHSSTKDDKSTSSSFKSAVAGLSALAVLLLLVKDQDGLIIRNVFLDSKATTPDYIELELELPSKTPTTSLHKKNDIQVILRDSKDLVPMESAHLVPVPPETFTYVDPRPFRHMPFGDLLSRYAVFALCCFPSLIDHAPALMDWALNDTSIPGVKALTEWVVRKTFFKQFVGAESAEECVPLLAQLSRANLGALFAFSVEMIHSKDGKSADLESFSARPHSSQRQGSKHIYDSIIDDLIESVEVAARFASRPAWADSTSPHEREEIEKRPSRDGSTMVAIKLSGVLKDPSVLERASSAIVSREFFSEPPKPSPPAHVHGFYGGRAGLAIPLSALSSAEDRKALRELWQGVRRLVSRAEEVQNVRLIVDAEYSWFQPAIDAIYESLAEEFNRIPKQGEKSRSSTNGWIKRIWGRRLTGAETEHTTRGESEVPGRVRGPLVYNTYQTYLRRTPSYLAASLERARANGYSLGVKLVRGAYVDQENAQWEDKDVRTPPASLAAERQVQLAEREREWRSPVWRNKTLTDHCFDGCAVRLVDEIALEMNRSGEQWPTLGVIFATHNWQSALKVTRRMLQTGLASPPPPELLRQKQIEFAAEGTEAPKALPTEEDAKTELVLLQVAPGVRGRIFFGQLLGMADSLTRRLQLAFDPVSGGVGPHMSLKYVPYGPLPLVMPYLVRRSVENKSVMQGRKGEEGAAEAERKLAGKEIRRRILPFL